MLESIIVAAITGGLSLIGTVITVIGTHSHTNHLLEVSQAVMNTKLEDLTREVREHNNFARRMPVVEEQIKTLQKKMDNLEDDLK